MNNSQIKLIGELRDQVDTELNVIINARDMPLYRLMSYHMGWVDPQGHSNPAIGRSRDHGVLCLMAFRASVGNLNTALPAAAAVELVYNFCQIHDDVQSGNPRRDNRDAVWWIWGPAQAINAGDGMHALARLALFRLMDQGVPPETISKALQILDEASLRTCEGRFLDLEAQERIDTNVASYIKMASSKTGALVSCAMGLGALIASKDEALTKTMLSSGTQIGLAMQLRSDLRELWDDDPSHPSPSLEMMNKKKLFPVVYALEKATVKEKRKMGEIYYKRVLDSEDISRLREIIVELGAKQECENLIKSYRNEALTILDIPNVSAQCKSNIGDFVDLMLK